MQADSSESEPCRYLRTLAGTTFLIPQPLSDPYAPFETLRQDAQG